MWFHFGDKELKRYNAYNTHIKDEDGFIANLFFGGEHTRCSSTAVLTHDGFYSSQLGEGSDAYLLANKLYNFEGRLFRIDNKPYHIISYHIIASYYFDHLENVITKKEYDDLVDSEEYIGEIKVIDNVLVAKLSIAKK